MKHVFAIPPAVFNSMDEFANSLTDTLKKARHPKNLDPQFSININKKVEDYFSATENLKMYHSAKVWLLTWALKLTNLFECLIRKDHTIPSPGQRQISLLILLDYIVLLYLDIVEPNSVGDVKCPLLRSFPFKHREFHNDEIFKRSQVLSYRNFEHLRFHKVIKSNFHSIHVELRNAAGHLVPFFPIGQVQLTLLFQKKS